MSRKAVEMEHLSPYRGFVRGIYREGSYTDDSDRQVTEDSGNGAFFYGWGGFGQYVY